MAKSLEKTSSSRKFCWNCRTYGWSGKTSAEENLSACSQCMLAVYCDKECQKEHWKKVHRKHCKYLAGKEINPISRHDDANCPKCKIEEGATPETIIQIDNPVYPCHIEYSYPGVDKQMMQEEVMGKDGTWKKVPNFVLLGELSGQFISKQDKNLAILQQILLKITAVHPGAFEGNNLYPEMIDCLGKLRGIIWSQSLISYSQEEIDILSEMRVFQQRQVVLNLLLSNVAKYHQSMIEFEKSDGAYKWWTSFIFFLNLYFQANFFYRALYDIQFLSNETLDKSEGTLDLKDFVLNNNFLDIWERLLTAATDKMVPFEDLLKIYCDGQLNRKCDQCANKIKVAIFAPGFLGTDIGDEDASPSLMFGLAILIGNFTEGQSYVSFGPKLHFSCGEMPCRMKTDSNVFKSRLLICAEGLTLAERFVNNRCDCCYRVTEKVHRCSGCKTKVYCTEECQNLDWKVHKLCCEKMGKSEEQQTRKKKGDGDKRNRVGVKKMNKFSGYVEGKRVSVGVGLIYSVTELVSERGFEAGFKAMADVMEDTNFDNLSEGGVMKMKLLAGLMKHQLNI